MRWVMSLIDVGFIQHAYVRKLAIIIVEIKAVADDEEIVVVVDHLDRLRDPLAHFGARSANALGHVGRELRDEGGELLFGRGRLHDRLVQSSALIITA